MDFGTARTLGGVGAILCLLSIVPHAGWVLGVAGLVLVLVALREFSDFYKDESIFRNALYAVILAIVGLVITGLIVAAGVFALLGAVGPGRAPPATPGMMMKVPTTAFVGLVALFVVMVVSAVFFRRSMDSMAERSGEGLFRTAGLIYLIGAVLIIAFGIGAVLIFISYIILAVAFFSLKPPQQAQAA